MNNENKTRENIDLKVDIIGDYLKDKSIALCVTGGIAAIETPKLARHLRRYGADVKAYMTPEAQKFIGKASLEWGTEQAVVTELSGLAEHISLEDLTLVAPATLNTVNKIMSGHADNVVTTLVASSLGMEKPIYLAPTMHESLYHNPIFKENLEKAKDYGIKIIKPRGNEGKKKMPRIDDIVVNVARELSNHPIKGKKLLITGGPTPGKIDDVRILSNVFKGTLAVEMAKEAYHRGADVKLLLGNTGIKVPDYLDVTYHQDFHEYKSNVFNELGKGYEGGIFSAAVADYIPVNKASGKIPSGGVLENIPLKQTSKVIKEVREKYPDLYMSTFKFQGNETSHEELMSIAKDRVNQGYDLVVANRSEEMKGGKHIAHIIGSEGEIYTPQSKKEIAYQLIGAMGERMK